jgi:hypothetical protein
MSGLITSSLKIFKHLVLDIFNILQVIEVNLDELNDVLFVVRSVLAPPYHPSASE